MTQRTITLGISARAKRALEALNLQHWMICNAEYVVGRRRVSVAYEKPSGERFKFEFDIEPTVDDEVEEWIEAELVRRLREALVAKL